MIRHKLARHFLPHYFVDSSFAEGFGGHDEIHHRAHGLTLGSLFAYLQILVVLTAGLYFIKLTVPQILGTASFGADQIIALTNSRREANGLSKLAFNPQLSQAATAKARDMIARDYWAHNSPLGATPWSFISAAGYRYIFAGENLARDFNDPSVVVEAWMNSPTHRANLLDKNFKEIGVAVEVGKLGGREGILVVQMFGTSPVTSLAQLPEAQKSVSENVGETQGVGEKQEDVGRQQTVDLGGRQARYLPGAGQVTVAAARKFLIAKAVSLTLVGFIFALFAIEVLVTLRRAHVHLRRGVLAHLVFLGFVLLTVWYFQAGAVI